MHASPFEFTSSPSPGNIRRQAEIQYFEAYTFYFNNPNWFLNLLLTMVCQFIPVVGPIVLLGYEYELILAKHLRSTRTYPDFDFGRFVEYLTRGIWPFLVQMIQGVVMVPFVMIGFIVFSVVAGVTAQGAGNDAEPVIVLVVFLGMFATLAIFLPLMAVVMTPLVLRAGLTCDLGKTFDFAFVKDFMSRVGWETVYATFFIVFTGGFLCFLGMLACYVGMFPATILVLIASTHLKWQLYELYLARGGTPIPLPETEVVVADRV